MLGSSPCLVAHAMRIVFTPRAIRALACNHVSRRPRRVVDPPQPPLPFFPSLFYRSKGVAPWLGARLRGRPRVPVVGRAAAAALSSAPPPLSYFAPHLRPCLGQALVVCLSRWCLPHRWLSPSWVPRRSGCVVSRVFISRRHATTCRRPRPMRIVVMSQTCCVVARCRGRSLGCGRGVRIRSWRTYASAGAGPK